MPRQLAFQTRSHNDGLKFIIIIDLTEIINLITIEALHLKIIKINSLAPLQKKIVKTQNDECELINPYLQQS